jgi:hypothetical protein
MYSSIQTAIPPLTLTAGQQTPLLLTPVFQGSQSFADFATFTLYLRQDPNYPRQTTAALAQAQVANPVSEGWPIALNLSGTQSGEQLLFNIPSTAGLASGPNAYSLSVVGTGGSAGTVVLFPETWCSVYPM